MVRIAKKLASKCRHPRYFHVALVVRGGVTLAAGWNSGWTHAEEMALDRLEPKERKNAKLWSLRFTKSGKLASAKPCPKCDRYLRESGVKTVYYSTDLGTVERLRLSSH
jgi:pyrimidine deaminase RibD-like protein